MGKGAYVVIGDHQVHVRSVLDGAALLEWAQRCVADLSAAMAEINALNVFPVADRDTGTNLAFTMRSALSVARELAEVQALPVARALARGAVRGARGNSGAIMSVLWQAFAVQVAESAKAGPNTGLDAGHFAAALRRADDAVRAAVSNPEEGTVISVLRSAADAAQSHGQLGEAVTAAASAAASALERTPQQLPLLAQSGVVDAGGRGLVVVLDALVVVVTGEPSPQRQYATAQSAAMPPAADAFPGPAAPSSAAMSEDGTESTVLDLRVPSRVASQEDSTFARPQFEVMYALDVHSHTLRADLEALGDSVVIVDSPDGCSVHVHTEDPGLAVEAGLRYGRPSDIRISLLDEHADRPRTVVAIVEGDAAAELFASEGAVVLRADDGADLSAKALLALIVGTESTEVILLPNGYVRAEEVVAVSAAARDWGRQLFPVPANAMVAGLAALAVHDASRIAVADVYGMAQAAAGTRYGNLRIATERALTWVGTCAPGDALGIVDDDVVVLAHDVYDGARTLLDTLLGAGGELVTALLGDAVLADGGGAELIDVLTDHVHVHHPAVELVIFEGRQSSDVVQFGVE